MTFSISARCAETGMIGIAVSSSSACVAARCAHARAGVGAVATQNITDPRLGPKGLDLMASGLSAQDALAALKRDAPHLEYRQLALVDSQGRTASFSGANTLGTHRVAEGPGVVAAGNLLADPGVPEAMVAAFVNGTGHLGDRLLAAMQAAEDAGGEEGPVHSVGMLITREEAWPIADLRVDWADEDPIGQLRQLWERWKGEMQAYIDRALNPSVAPSYGVPGDL
ncbi:DUF1028 domain-containing protein [Pseudogemmobacter faecipullorum]|uniref:DUF1028 domain-containing protein n=1 Tax=Pseudogemmobacter faecipullorum TaxID=2755041 RepID=A0ABS8CNH7_9RHOB|nr:DUF1028 domain-containing protein [Pseudogemmobacter faecipullorum]MCB5410943.1 DUF1028 domain-containing protein [Pseudogemmobacter faecipullorum]